MRFILFAFILLAQAAQAAAQNLPATSEEFDTIKIGGAQLYKPAKPFRDQRIITLQIIMDRAGFSPGVIDGLDTKRFHMQLRAFKTAHNHDFKLNDQEAVAQLLAQSGGDAFVDYEITAKDLSYKFTPDIPERYVDQASMHRIDFTSAQEMFAERFHMDEQYLIELNEGKDFSKAGETIKVAAFGKYLQKRIARIEADKKNLQVRAYDAKGNIVATYPASIGSTVTPSPTGTHTVRNKAQNPAYTYDPNGSAQPGQSKGLVLLPPGPNGPVGDAWIGLSKKTYGIHGTPDPSNIGVTASVGCVRLTNWDALELARLVNRGVQVTFIE
ncbi:L,D-transpeptidase [Ahrensia sp. 13_GOM-1096m]|uniref:L,D-transpeptidase n=1 Tax=Ahrensia sp. 13_GOM-1096m TaxID=1380380 RepID=UPI0006844956|nr:L,D-transpeptidase [Ahrensia sp. 13_GOM-1096m]